MRSVRDVLWVALSGLRARAGRATLMSVGPMLGAAVIVASFGVLESAQGDLRAALRGLGQNLLVVSAPEGARLPVESSDRIAAVSSVAYAGGLRLLDGALAYANDPAGGSGRRVGAGVYAADPGLGDTLDVDLAWGRDLGEHDETSGTMVAVVGSNVAKSLMVDPAELQVLFVDDHPLAVVGVLEPSLVAPELDGAVLVPHRVAARLGSDSRAPGYDFVYARADERLVEPTVQILPVAVTYGERGVQPRIAVPAQLLSAQVAIDATLAGAVLGLGLLAMAIGGFGIANVMLISVMERRREIGVRRALGHTRRVVAVQFLAEGAVVGVAGAVAGVALAAGFVAAVAWARGWVFIANPSLMGGAVAAAAVITLLAAVYPAVRAARMEPLVALRGD